MYTHHGLAFLFKNVSYSSPVHFLLSFFLGFVFKGESTQSTPSTDSNQFLATDRSSCWYETSDIINTQKNGAREVKSAPLQGIRCTHVRRVFCAAPTSGWWRAFLLPVCPPVLTWLGGVRNDDVGRETEAEIGVCLLSEEVTVQIYFYCPNPHLTSQLGDFSCSIDFFISIKDAGLNKCSNDGISLWKLQPLMKIVQRFLDL